MHTMPGRITIREVADAAGVSRQTVSNSLIHPERVKAPTLERVRRVIDELGYRPSNAAQTLRSQRTGAVGFELNATGAGHRNAVAFPFVLALSVHAAAHGSHMVTFGTHDERPLLAGYQDMVRGQLVDAFILADTHPGDPRPQWLDDNRVPYAAFGRLWGRPDITSWADVDGHHGVGQAVRHLLDAGYDRIGYFGWPAGSAVGDDRRAGWADELDTAGIRPGPEGVSSQRLQPALEAGRGLLDRIGKGGAVVCASDLLALGLERAASERGWHIGPDVGIVGFDDSALAELAGISSVAQPLDAVADHLLGVVHERLAGGRAPDTGALFQPRLVTRASSSRDPHAL